MRQKRAKKENHFEKIIISKDLSTILIRISFRDSKVTLNNKTWRISVFLYKISFQNVRTNSKFKQKHNHRDQIRLERLIYN